MNQPVIQIKQLNKRYQSGFQALDNINLDIHRGEIFALLGPNGAGKTTLISTLCGIVTATTGTVLISGFDHQVNYKQARQLIGLVPQELTTDAFEKVMDTVSFSRGLFGLPPNPALIESILKSLSLWSKRNDVIMSLSGGMKRRLMIAKALSHEPKILFLDEPTAGVDVELRRDMWQMVHQLREQGVTIILTTHYIEEAEEMADRIGIIQNGKLILVQEKDQIMQKLGNRTLTLQFDEPITEIPSSLHCYSLELSENQRELHYHFKEEHPPALSELLSSINLAGLEYKDIRTHQRSLEEIFVDLVKEKT